MKPFLSAVLLASLTAPLAAQDDATVVVDEQGRATFAAGEHELAEVVAWMSDYLDVDFLLDASECGGGEMRIRTRHDVTVDRERAWDLFNSLLSHRGMAILPLNRELEIYEVINQQGQKRAKLGMAAVLMDVKDIDRFDGWSAMPVLCSVELEHINATIATNALRPFFAGSAGSSAASLQIGNVGDQRSLMLLGMGDQVAAATRMITQMDRVSAPNSRDVLVVRLEHVHAAELAAQLEAFTNRGPQHQGMANPDEQFRIAVHPSTNSILLSGSGDDIEKMKRLIATLDVPVEGGQQPAGRGAGMPAVDAQIRQLEAQIELLQKQVEALRKQAIR